jgi:DNA-directed RNA polymerase subunit F
MSKINIVSEEPICEFELRKELEKTKKREGELNFRANRTLEHLNEVCKLSAKKGEELKKSLIDLNIPRMKDEVICKIVDLLPQDEEELKNILQTYNLTVSKNNVKSILKAVSEHI